MFGGNHPDFNEYFACYDIMSGGWGGRYGHDGNDCVIAINGNCRFNPTEVFEMRFPFRVEISDLFQELRAALANGAADLATHERCWPRWSRLPAVSPVIATRSKPWPIFGGEPGGNGSTLIRKAGSMEWKTVRELYK